MQRKKVSVLKLAACNTTGIASLLKIGAEPLCSFYGIELNEGETELNICAWCSICCGAITVLKEPSNTIDVVGSHEGKQTIIYLPADQTEGKSRAVRVRDELREFHVIVYCCC